MLTFEVRHGHDVLPLVREFTAFRLEEFRKFPYLYEGMASSEQSYLEAYAAHPNSILVMVRDNGLAVGMFTALPLLAESFPSHASVAVKLSRLEHDPIDFFYFGEAILRPEYQARGLGRKACSMLEAYARLLGYSRACMATVERSAVDGRRPADYQNPERVFRALGFHKIGLETILSWPTIQSDGSVQRQENTMNWWIKNLQRLPPPAIRSGFHGPSLVKG